MARRTGEQARQAIDGHREEHWLRWLRTTEFQAGLNKLRRKYAVWVLGPPMFQTITHGDCEEDLWDVTGEIKRSQVQRPAEVDEREDEFIAAWESFERKYGVRLPVDALKPGYPDLMPETVAEWQTLYDIYPDILPPAVVDISNELSCGPPAGTVAIQFGDYLPGDLKETLLRQITRKSERPKTRCRGDKRAAQYQLAQQVAAGHALSNVAAAEGISLSTAKSRLAAQARRTGHKPSAKGFKADHVKACPICGPRGGLVKDCPTAGAWMNQHTMDEKEKTPCRQPSTRAAVAPF
jgi:hypothetical protein